MIFWQFSIQFSIFNNFKQTKIDFGQFSIQFLIFQIQKKLKIDFLAIFNSILNVHITESQF